MTFNLNFAENSPELQNAVHNVAFERIWNGKELVDVRNKMLNNELVKFCSYCQDQEKLNITSMRKGYMEKYFDDAWPMILEAINNLGKVKQPPKYLDIRWDNKCNLKCRICTPISSHLIEKELRENASLFKKINIEPYESYEVSEANDEKMAKLILRLAKDLKYIKLHGGEPMINKKLWRVLEEIPNSNDIEFTIFTNGMTLHDSQLKLLKNFSGKI